jgi:hypothetical protein
VSQSDFEIDSIRLTPTYDSPLASGELKISDILADDDSSHFKTDEDGLLYIAYDDELLSHDIRNLFELHDLPVDRSFIMPGAVVPPHNKDIRVDSIQSKIDFGLSPEKLDEIALNSGRITYEVELAPSFNLDYEVFLVLSGFKSRTTSKSLNTVIGDEGVIDISDYTISLDDNKFDLKLVLVYKKTNSSTTIPPASSVNVRLKFEDLEFDYIKGFLGDQVTTIDPRTIPISVFEKGVFHGAEISLAQPRVSITVLNENGVPCTVHFTKLEARKEGASPMAIALNPANPVEVAAPAIMGDTQITHIGVANVNDIMNYAPAEFFYQADVHINEGIASGDNFVVDSSKMKVRMNIEVPLWGSATGIVLQDTLNVDLENVENSEVVTATLKVNLVNEFPLGGDVQFILTDENYLPLSTLLKDDQTGIIKASKVDSNGELEAAGEFEGELEIDQTKIDNLFKSKHLIVMVNLQTSRNASGNAIDVKFMEDYGLVINTKVIAALKMTIE